jgi:glycine dehydrogenase subunit 1
MTYIPISPNERDEMLKTVGVKSLDDLFDAIPKKHRFPQLDLPPAWSEMEAAAMLGEMAASNENVREHMISFLGAGTITTFLPLWITCCAAVNSIQPTHPINLKFHKAHCRPSLNSNP